MKLFNILSFNKNKKWKVLFRNSKGAVKVARVVAQDKFDVFKQMEKSFTQFDVIRIAKM